MKKLSLPLKHDEAVEIPDRNHGSAAAKKSNFIVLPLIRTTVRIIICPIVIRPVGAGSKLDFFGGAKLDRFQRKMAENRGPS